MYDEQATRHLTMPRDLESEKATLQGMPPLTKSPAQDSPSVDEQDTGDRLMRDMQKGRQRDELHPLVQTLNPSYIDSCVKLEEATFPEDQRGSREKVSHPQSLPRLPLAACAIAHLPLLCTAASCSVQPSVAPITCICH